MALRIRHVLGCACWILTALHARGAEAPAPRAPPAWYENFALRRRIVFARPALKGDAVLLRVPTAGAAHADGRDVRVVADHRYPYPVEILETGPGDSVLLRFEVHDPSREHHVYLGSSAAGRPRRPRLPPRGGLLLEVFELGEGSCDSWPQMRKLLKASTRRIGFAAPPSIFLGIPPLGRETDYAAVYTGWLRVKDEGPYTFETASRGGSFVLVDGKLVASWPGFHGLKGCRDPAKRKQHSGTVSLRPGVHRIEYLVATRSSTTHVLAWQPPGKERTRPIASRSFVPWLPAKLAAVETRGDPVAYFDWEIAGDTGSDARRHDLAEVAFRFSGDLKGRRGRRIRWKFGDGQTAEGEAVRHVYLRHGAYKVAVEAAFSRDITLKAEREILVRFESTRRTDLDALLERYYKATRDYALDDLPASHLEQLVWLRSKDDRWKKDLFDAVDACYRRDLPQGASLPERVEELGMKRAVDLLRRGARRDLSRRILEVLSRGASSPERRDTARVRLARLDLLSAKAQAAKPAEKTLEELYGRPGATDATRRAGIFLAEIRIRQGREEEARKILERVEREDGFRRFQDNRGVSSGARDLSFENLLKTGRLDDARRELERWKWELPTDLLTGVLEVREARLLLAQERPADALRELEGVWKLEEASREKPRALLLAADALEAKGDSRAAREKLQEVVRDFPHRPESKEAARRLGK